MPTDDLDDLDAVYLAACDLEDAGELEGAVAIFRQLAEGGFLEAQVRVADILETLDRPVEAIRCYRRAVRSGSATAAHNLAILYRNRNRRGGYIRWLRIAAAMGDGDAPTMLETATTQDHVWWAIEDTRPPSFVPRLRLVRD